MLPGFGFYVLVLDLFTCLLDLWFGFGAFLGFDSVVDAGSVRVGSAFLGAFSGYAVVGSVLDLLGFVC